MTLLPARDAAAILHVSEATVRRHLPAVRIGRSVHVGPELQREAAEKMEEALR